MNRFTRFSSWAVLAGALTVGVATATAQQELIEASKNSGQWVMPGRTYDLQRHSPLKQITTANVKDLQVAWTFSTGVLRGHEGNPLVIGHVMYVQSAFPNKVFALDLTKPGAPQIWQFTPEQPADVIPIACCDVVNRGLAYSPKYDRLFIELLSGDLLALDAKTGKQVFRVKSADYKKGETMTNAPLVVGDAVITGISGGEFGVRGRVTTFSAVDGHELWRAYSTGPDKDVMITANTLKSPYPTDQGTDLGVSTWQGDEWQRGGGTTWGWYSYDPELNLFYYGSGNPGVWNPDQRPGDNKWSMSIWARNPQTGEVKWVYQMTPHDAWDYDGVNEMVLFDKDGKKLLAHFDRNGFGYTLDRATGKVLVAEPYGPVNWATKIDLTTGRPVEDASKRTNAKGNTTGICPAAIGFKDQQPSSYDPETGYFFVPTNNICMDYEGVEVKYSAGQPYVGAIVRMFPGPGGNRGAVIAWDPMKGKIVWKDKENLAAYGGTLNTAGGVVFYGTMEGWLKAVDSKTGKLLWEFKTPSGIIGSPMTYTGPDGKQYVAVLSGIGGWAGIGVAAGIGAEDPTAGLGALGAFGDAGHYSNQGGVLTVFTLPGAAK
ncbi:MAG TPA: methanol/ethanol family PQQ-dependent dehydrogenase [Gemmatimonadaceae bacterium]|nr:methanol/ethanol family PQQ-dependent dehydrogenase [Gemmatimonadaceae bacterium]